MSFASYSWTPDSVAIAVTECRLSSSKTEAVGRVQAALNWPVTYNSIKGAFRRTGHPTLVSLLKPDGSQHHRPLSPPPPPPYTNLAADISSLEWDDEDDKTQRVEAVPTADRTYVDRTPPKRTTGWKLDTWLIWSDVHCPFHDKSAFELVLKVGHAIKPHGTAVIGDFMDGLSVSSHPKAPEQMRVQLKDEVESANGLLDQIDALGCVEKKFFGGNHDIRGQRAAMRQMIGLYDSLAPDHLFKLKERGWQYFRYQQHSPIGKINLVHDLGYSGKYAAYANGAAFEASVATGHTHRASLTYFGNVSGERHVSATIGWLGSKEAADYLAPIKSTRDWQTSFALIYVNRETQISHLQIVPIIEGECMVNGQLFEA